MTFSITLGWWVLPLIVTIASSTWALWDRPSERGGFIPSPMPLIRLAGALIVSLIAWLIWALVR